MRPVRNLIAVLALILSVSPMNGQPTGLRLIVPGVWFRTGAPLPIGDGIDIHENTMIVEMENYLVVIDSGTENTARGTLADCKALSAKPLKYVFLTHHHFDHVGGNAIWIRAGATTMAFPGVRDELIRSHSTFEFPKKIIEGNLFVLDDGKRRLEFRTYGWAHTKGDGVAFLPKEKVLFTGDIVLSAPYNSFFDANVRRWPSVIRKLEKLRPVFVLPGHGEPGSADLLVGQRAFLEFLIARVEEARLSGAKLETLVSRKEGQRAVSLLSFPPELKRWSDGPFTGEQVAEVYRQLTR